MGEMKEKNLLVELKTLFAKEAGFWRKMSVDERELRRRTAKAKRKLAETKVSIVRVSGAIKKMKIEILKQVRMSHVFERQRAAMVRDERRYKLKLMSKIRGVRMYFKKEKERLRALLSR